MKISSRPFISFFRFSQSKCRGDSLVGPSARASLRMTYNYVPMCLCAYVPLLVILEFGFWIGASAQSLPGVWESHGPYTHAQTTAFYIDTTTSRLYVATLNQGVYVSESGGSSWDQLSAPMDTAFITHFIKINETLFAASVGNLYFTDDGLTWTPANPPSEQSPAAGNTNLSENFIISFKDVLYSGTVWGSGLFTSSDDGANWDPVPTSLDDYIITTFLQANDTLFAATLDNGVYYTTDGSIWIHGGTAIESKSISHLLQVGNILLAGGSDGLFVSSDGATWNAADSPLDTLTITLLYNYSGTVYAVASGGNAGLFYSDDSTSSWNPTLAGEEVNCLIAAGEFLYAGSESGLFSSTVGINDWQAVQLNPNPGAIMELAIGTTDIYARSYRNIFQASIDEQKWFPTNEIRSLEKLHGLILKNSFILAYGSHVYRSLDKGFTWITDYPPIEWGSESVLKIVETNNGFLAAAGGIFHSPDGIVWTHQPSQLDQEILTTLITAGGTLLAGTVAQGIFHSSDGGMNWTQANAPMDHQHVYFIYDKENELFGGTKNGLFTSENGGADWTHVSGIPDSIAVLSFNAYADTLMTGTGGQGIYYSVDSGLNWIHAVAPLDDGQIEKLFRHRAVVIAGTDDENLFISRNGGITWTPAEAPLKNLNLTDFSFVDDVLFISTWDTRSGTGGIYRSIDTSRTWTSLNKNMSRTSPLLAPLYLPSQNRLYTCGDGVYYQFFDLEPPLVTRFSPNDTSRLITDLNIQLAIEANAADSMILSERTDFADTHWRHFQPVAEFTLTPSQGIKTIYARFKDFSVNISDTISTQVELDNLAPVFTGEFLETNVFAETCPDNVDEFTWRNSFEELRIPSAEQNWMLGPQCRDFPYHAIRVRMTYWPVGTSFRTGVTITGLQPDCPETGFPGGPWRWYNCYRIGIPGSALDNKGIDFKILATDTAGNNSTFINRKYTIQPLEYFSVAVQLGGRHLGQSDILPGGVNARAFRIVSVPFKVPRSNPLFYSKHLGRFGDYGPNGDWMFWFYEGDGSWINGTELEINDGSGYFILLREAQSLKPFLPYPEPVLTSMPTTAGVWGEIPGWQLRANDWTIIGNPYRTRIELDQLKLKNRNIRLDQATTELGIYVYSYTGWINNDLALEPWGGLAVFLADTSAGADTIVFANAEEPYVRPLDKSKNVYAKQLASLEEGKWLVQIRAESGGLQDNTNFFGVRSDAQVGHDIYDWYEPPRLPGGISVSFPHSDWSVPTSYASDIRAVTNDGYTWPLQVTADGGTVVSLHFETLGTLPDNFQIWLIDEVTAIARDLRTQPQIHVRIPEQSNSKQFKIIVGTESFIKQHSNGENTLPNDFVLYQNYPNPFNPVTIIRYALPLEGRVTLQIYDVMGRRVVETPELNLYREPGYYETMIDMSHYASGLYFYSIHVDGERRFQKTLKMLFIK